MNRLIASPHCGEVMYKPSGWVITTSYVFVYVFIFIWIWNCVSLMCLWRWVNRYLEWSDVLMSRACILFGAYLCVSERNLKTRLLTYFELLCIKKSIYSPAHSAVDHLSPAAQTNISKQSVTPCPIVLAAAVMRRPSTYPAILFVCIAPSSRTSDLRSEL